NGTFTLADVGPGVVRVREVVQSGWTQTTTNPSALSTSSGVPVAGVTFGDHQQAVVNVNTTTSLSGPPTPPVSGQTATFTATVAAVAPGAGTPGGTVSFLEGATLLGTGTLDNLGSTSFTTSSLGVGPHTITATYNGDGNFNPSSANLGRTVAPADTTTAL